MSQVLLSNKVGITFQQVQKYESGVRISASRLYEFAEALEVPVSYFFDGLPNTDCDPDGKKSDLAMSISTAECFAGSSQGAEIANLFVSLPTSSHRRLVQIIREIASIVVEAAGSVSTEPR